MRILIRKEYYVFAHDFLSSIYIKLLIFPQEEYLKGAPLGAPNSFSYPNFVAAAVTLQ